MRSGLDILIVFQSIFFGLGLHLPAGLLGVRIKAPPVSHTGIRGAGVWVCGESVCECSVRLCKVSQGC